MSVQIGLSDLYYALLETDVVGSEPIYQAPVRLPGIITANINPNGSSETLFAENGPFETASTLGKIGLELNAADIPLDTQAVWLGHTKEGGILKRKGADVPPWLAIGFKSLKSNGKFRFTWLAKGKFALPEQNNETKGDSINFQTPTMQGSFVQRDCDGEWERHCDEDDVDYIPAIGTGWFTDPLGDPDITVPVVNSVVPADAATAIAVGSSVVWTFNVALARSTVTLGNFMLISDTGTNVAGTLTLDASRKIVTFDPTNNLTAATKYKAITSAGIKSLITNRFAII
jgi:phi13 family phage major tail protein